MKEIISLSLLLFQIAACSHSSTQKNPPTQVALKKIPQEKHFSHCQWPQFSRDGQQMLAICTSPSRHVSHQIYLFDLQKKTSRRVTWQDGDITEALWFEENHIVYTSTTDEIKESLFRPTEDEKNDDRTEIYLSDLYGNHIERLTNHPGPDQDLNLQSTELSYVSTDHGKRRLFRMNLKSNHKAQEVLGLPMEKMLNTIPFGHRKWIWLEKRDESTNLLLQTFDKNQSLPPTPQGTKWLKRISSENGFLTGSKQISDSATILSWIPENLQCVKQIYQAPAEILSADLSERSGLLALTIKSSDQNDVEIVPIDSNTLTCTTAPSQDSLNP